MDRCKFSLPHSLSSRSIRQSHLSFIFVCHRPSSYLSQCIPLRNFPLCSLHALANRSNCRSSFGGRGRCIALDWLLHTQFKHTSGNGLKVIKLNSTKQCTPTARPG